MSSLGATNQRILSFNIPVDVASSSCSHPITCSQERRCVLSIVLSFSFLSVCACIRTSNGRTHARTHARTHPSILPSLEVQWHRSSIGGAGASIHHHPFVGCGRVTVWIVLYCSAAAATTTSLPNEHTTTTTPTPTHGDHSIHYTHSSIIIV